MKSLLLVFGALAAIYVGICVQYYWDTFTVNDYALSSPLPRSGPYVINHHLTKAEKLCESLVTGPESFEIVDDKIYTGLMNGTIAEIVDGKVTKMLPLNEECSKSRNQFAAMSCSRPGGIRRLNKEELIVADVYLGIVIVNMEAMTSKVVFSVGTLVNGVAVRFPDDLDVLNEDTIIFSDATTKWASDDFPNEMWELYPSGRLIQLNLKTKETKVLAKDLGFSNGVQIFPDKKSVLVAESTAARITRVYIAGDKAGTSKVFMDNLPAYPDNIRMSYDGKSFWVGLFTTRFAGEKSIYEQILEYPVLRKSILSIVPKIPKFIIYIMSIPSGAITINVGFNGEVIKTLQDPQGTVIREISQTTETKDYLYFANFHRSYFHRLRKADLP
ncbi:hypothetical protein L596_019706 [Steinernema carpocapsae]|uniref:Strictosidine synthase conserved region domain-containing protein n=1 Tax=Steinernema carpocapsae TaxID=34508 RepID=A0A4U5MRU6_STECR|nr:hypothetical protein L596_019706 [Steinernema carpocapsae]